MKITEVRSLVAGFGASNYVFVKVLTDEGIHGVGECTLEGKENTVLGAIEDLRRLTVGSDPRDIERLWVRWNRFSAWKGAPAYTAMSGIEQALWDISGKAVGLPVHRLLGGAVRDRVRTYTWPTPYANPAELVGVASAAIDRYGYTAIKIDPFGAEFHTIGAAGLRALDAYMKALRTELGEDLDIAVDAHWRFQPSAAIEIARVLEPYRVLFLEEPVISDNEESLARVRARVSVPIATGERHLTRWQCWPLVRDRLADILQADVCHTGGILELRKIASMAEPAGVLIAPHNPNGPIGLAATVHVAAATPNFLITETVHHRNEVAHRLVDQPLEVVDGHIAVPDRPGLGVDLDEDAIAAHPPDFKEIWEHDRVVV